MSNINKIGKKKPPAENFNKHLKDLIKQRHQAPKGYYIETQVTSDLSTNEILTTKYHTMPNPVGIYHQEPIKWCKSNKVQLIFDPSSFKKAFTFSINVSLDYNAPEHFIILRGKGGLFILAIKAKKSFTTSFGFHVHAFYTSYLQISEVPTKCTSNNYKTMESHLERSDCRSSYYQQLIIETDELYYFIYNHLKIYYN